MQGNPFPRAAVTMGLRGERPAINAPYLRSLEAAGVASVFLAPGMSEGTIGALLDVSHGLVLTGGGDICPDVYGEPQHPEVEDTSGERDAMELTAVRIALDRRLPVLAICRGLQLVNVAKGGTLHQHIPDTFGNSLQHRQEADGIARAEPSHAVAFESSSALKSLFGGPVIHVNSMHHQAINGLGRGLRAVGHAPDGVIEAVESSDLDQWLLGVQWHPEELTASEDSIARSQSAALFAAFASELRSR